MNTPEGWKKKGEGYWEGPKVLHGHDYAISHITVSKNPMHWKQYGVFIFNAKSRKQVINRTNLTKEKATNIAVSYMERHSSRKTSTIPHLTQKGTGKGWHGEPRRHSKASKKGGR